MGGNESRRMTFVMQTAFVKVCQFSTLEPNHPGTLQRHAVLVNQVGKYTLYILKVYFIILKLLLYNY